MFQSNTPQLKTSELKQLACEIFSETLAAVDVAKTMRRKLTLTGSRLSIMPASSASGAMPGEAFAKFAVDLEEYNRIRVVAFGKASIEMTRGLLGVLGGEWGLGGIVVAPHVAAAGAELPSDVLRVDGRHDSAGAEPTESARADAHDDLERFQIIRAGHPAPDEGSFLAARAILDLLSGTDARTLVFFLLSGGGSSLVEMPLDAAITLAEMQELHQLLVHCGAPIDEINAVRKHLSAVKGGRLAAAAPTAMKVTLGVTDVPAGCESALGSGPTIPDPTTVSDARNVIERYRLWPKLPAAIEMKFRAELEQAGEIPETPKAGDPAFALSHFTLLLGMSDLFHHAHRAAEARGFITLCDNATDDWGLAPAADYLLGELSRLAAANPGRRVAVIADGEVSSPVTGNGMGGRNSAFVLACAEKIAEMTRKVARKTALGKTALEEAALEKRDMAGRKIAILSAGTDGKDGSSPAAGAVADEETLEKARRCGLDPEDFARRSDSYNFFHALGDTVETGPTGNNLRDLRVLLAE